MIHDLAYFVAGTATGVAATGILIYAWWVSVVVGNRVEP